MWGQGPCSLARIACRVAVETSQRNQTSSNNIAPSRKLLWGPSSWFHVNLQGVTVCQTARVPQADSDLQLSSVRLNQKRSSQAYPHLPLPTVHNLVIKQANVSWFPMRDSATAAPSVAQSDRVLHGKMSHQLLTCPKTKTAPHKDTMGLLGVYNNCACPALRMVT